MGRPSPSEEEVTALAERLFRLLAQEQDDNLVMGKNLTGIAIDGIFDLKRIARDLITLAS